MENYDCIIIDTGVNTFHSKFKNRNITGLGIKKNKGLFEINDDFVDLNGHGTAVYDIITRYTREAKILNINLFGEMNEIDEELLIWTLEYIANNYNCRVINLSMGLLMCNEGRRLYECCKAMADDGVIICSAYDNGGAMSYPAAYDCVLGVDSSDRRMKPFEFEFVEESPVNILAKGGNQKVVGLGDNFVLVRGSSFSCAYITAIVINMIQKERIENLDSLIKKLKKTAISVRKAFPEVNENRRIGYKITNSLLFPLNKELIDVVAFSDLLPFEIYGISDTKYSGKVNKRAGDLIKFCQHKKTQNIIIQNIEYVNWLDDFDSVIIGHCAELSSLIGKDIQYEIIEKSIKFNKKVFSLDDRADLTCLHKNNNVSFYHPCMSNIPLPQNRFGKLYQIGKPVVCVAGTNSSQGKFTLQLYLRKIFMEKGYNIGQLGTEPTSELFGMDEVYHYGYSVENYPPFEHTVMKINQLMHNIEDKNPDLILTGLQGGVIPYTNFNLSYYTNRQLELLSAILPDVVILCVNPEDDIDFIQQSIKFIESYVQTHVVACVVFPMRINESFQFFGNKREMDRKECEYIIKKFENELERFVVLNDYYGAIKVAEVIIEYLSS